MLGFVLAIQLSIFRNREWMRSLVILPIIGQLQCRCNSYKSVNIFSYAKNIVYYPKA